MCDWKEFIQSKNLTNKRFLAFVVGNCLRADDLDRMAFSLAQLPILTAVVQHCLKMYFLHFSVISVQLKRF